MYKNKCIAVGPKKKKGVVVSEGKIIHKTLSKRQHINKLPGYGEGKVYGRKRKLDVISSVTSDDISPKQRIYFFPLITQGIR